MFSYLLKISSISHLRVPHLPRSKMRQHHRKRMDSIANDYGSRVFPLNIIRVSRIHLLADRDFERRSLTIVYRS